MKAARKQGIHHITGVLSSSSVLKVGSVSPDRGLWRDYGKSVNLKKARNAKKLDLYVP